MADAAVNPHRVDPYKHFRFRVSWRGRVIAGVSRISGVRRVTESIEVRNGADLSPGRKLPGRTQFDAIVLERGITADCAFADWARTVWNPDSAPEPLQNYRRDIVIELLDATGAVVLALKVFGTWVSEYQAFPDLEAESDVIAIERIRLENEGWERDCSVIAPLD